MISVLMSVYNNENTIEVAARSILEQSYTDFEFIIINDGSTDKSGELLKALAKEDPRIVLIEQENMGLTKSLNKAALMAKGEFLARQDADDFSFPGRFKKQVELIEKKQLSLIGSSSIDVFADGSEKEWGYIPDKIIHKQVQFCTPFPHSSVMIRKVSFDEVGGYDETLQTSQDMELWMRISKRGTISMIQEPLIKRSVHPSSISGTKKFQQFKDGLRARLRHYEGSPLYAVYFSFRSYAIALAPLALIRGLKKLK